MEPRIGQAQAGFTLIELMIVVTILSLLTLSVSLGLGRPSGERAQDWSRFAAMHAQLHAQAVLSGDLLGLAVDEGGYQRLRWQGDDWQPQGGRGTWRAPVAVMAPQDRGAPMVFSPGGGSSPVNLRFGAGSAARFCVSDGWTPVSCTGA